MNYLIQSTLEDQYALELKYSKRLASNQVKEYLDALELELDPVLETVVIQCLLGLGKNLPIQSIVNILINTHDMDVMSSTKFLLDNAGQYYNLVNYEKGNIIIKPLVRLPSEMVRKISLTTVLPPLLVKPKNWSKNGKQGGYYSLNHTLVLGKENQHKHPVSVDAINKLQSIAWCLDTDILLNFVDDTSYNLEKAMSVSADIVGKEFYFMWQYDKRGRMYSRGYEVNLQSSQYHKALLSFANAEVVTEEGLEEILLWVANTAGYDKLSWSDRLAKGKELVDSRVSFTEDDQVTIDTEGVSEPILFTKAVIAYYDALQGKPIGLPVMWDCTASGLQCLAILTGCRETAKKVNLTNSGKREDVYQYVVELMNQQLNVNDHVNRDKVKKPFMTHWYSSKAGPSEAFNKHQLDAFYKALNKGFTGPELFMYLVNEVIWEDKSEFMFTLPDGHTAVIRTMVNETTHVEIDDDVYFNYEQSVNQPNNNNKHMCANLTHAVDAYIARELIRRCDFEVAHIHDSFVTHPNNARTMRRIFKEILADVSRSDLLESIFSQLKGTHMQVDKLCDDLYLDILQSEYALS